MIPARTLSVFVMGMENFPGFSAKARTRKDASNRIEMAFIMALQGVESWKTVCLEERGKATVKVTIPEYTDESTHSHGHRTDDLALLWGKLL
jgi:hypothetical protein